MQYTLTFSANRIEPNDVVEFEAEDAADALIIAHQQTLRTSAELWCGNRQLCKINRAPQVEGVTG